MLLLLIPINTYALADNSKSAILIDANTKSVLYEHDSDLELPMASMTKMMTLLIIMEKLDSGVIKLDDMVPISQTASSMGGSQIYLKENTKMKLDVLLKSIVVASANDSAYALSEFIAGSSDEFVKMMNDKSKELKLNHTNFKNVHGLDADGHYSSAHDMAIIASELVRHDKIFDYTKIYEDYVEHPDGTNTWIVNTNKLINYYDGLDGLKTGYTINSGYCITATAKKNNLRLISVVMGASTNNLRNQDTIELLNYGFANYKIDYIIKEKDDLGTINVKFGKKEKVKLKVVEDATNITTKESNNDYSYKVETKNIEAPVKVGDIVGKLTIYNKDKIINEIDLTVEEDSMKANFFDLWKRNTSRIINGYN